MSWASFTPGTVLAGRRETLAEVIVDRLSAVADSRRALWITAVLAACLPWLSHRLPMIDLPQHAAQVALWRDMLLGVSPWSEFVRLNLFTPYLVGYGIALPLSVIMSPDAALALVLSGAALAFVAAASGLRRELGADPRLDWLLITPFFGFAWQWGFFSFLVVAPLVLLHIRLSVRYVRAPSAALGLWLVALGLLLLIAHALAFLFACAVGGALLIVERRSLRGVLQGIAPFGLLGAVFLASIAWSNGFGAPGTSSILLYGPGPPLRLLITFAYGHGFTADLMLLSLLSLLAPFAMGLRIDPRSCTPLVVLLLLVLTVPQVAMGTGFLFERFGLFALPLFVVMFTRTVPLSLAEVLRAKVATALLPMAAWLGVGLMAAFHLAFAREAADFETVLARAEPGKRALALILDTDSPAARHPKTYLHHAHWYQADKGGLVDFNFAHYHPQVVRYRKEQAPPAGIGFEWEPEKVDWHKHKARIYDYYFVRHGVDRVLPPGIIGNTECAIETVASAGTWTLLKRGACR